NPRDDLQKSTVVRPLGEGGSGVVFKVAQVLHHTITIERALKLFMYRENIAALTFHSTNMGISNKDFLNEIINISGFSHENLVKVTDAGLHTIKGQEIPYIVTDFVAGPTLKDIIEYNKDQPEHRFAETLRARMTSHPEDALRILIQMASAITFLHEREFLHCDVAPKNVFLKSAENFRVVLGDLGAGRSLKQAGQRRVIGTKGYMPPEIHRYLYKLVSAKTFSTFFPRWDIYAFAKSSLEFVESLSLQRTAWFNPLISTLRECQEGTGYATMLQITERLRWLLSVNRNATHVPELSPTLVTKNRRLMPVEPLATTARVRRLLWHPALLRLAKVPQLTAAPHVFPGAVHTRYEHSLGTMETMRRYLINLVGQDDFQEHLRPDKIETALLAALFSSLTKFPLSSVIREFRGLPAQELAPFSKEVLLDELFQRKDSEGLTLPDLLARHFPRVDIKCIRNILSDQKGKFSKEDELIYSLLNCSLDVRVIDFVRRDSLHLGIARSSFDFEDLLAHLKILHHKLGLAISGVSVAEEIITLRYTLFNRIYWNRPNRAFVAMIRHVLIALRSTGIFPALRQVILDSAESDILDLLLKQATYAGRPELIDILELIRRGSRRTFNVILEASPKEDSELSVVCQRVREMNHLANHDLARALFQEVSALLPLREGAGNITPLLVDIPSEPGNGNKLGDDILVINPNEMNATPQNLSHISGIVKGVNDSFNEYLCRMRILLHPKVYPENEETRQIVYKRIKECLLRTLP